MIFPRDWTETRIISMVEKATDRDELTSVIGSHGKFQLRVFLIVQFVGVFAAWQILVSSQYIRIFLRY